MLQQTPVRVGAIMPWTRGATIAAVGLCLGAGIGHAAGRAVRAPVFGALTVNSDVLDLAGAPNPAFGDWDGDGDPDVVVVEPGSVVLFENDGAGNFTVAAIEALDGEIMFFEGQFTGTAILDVDGDGVNEFVAFDQDDNFDGLVQVLENPFGSPPPANATADFNKDGVVDGADLGRLLGGWGPVE